MKLFVDSDRVSSKVRILRRENKCLKFFWVERVNKENVGKNE